MQHDQGCRLVPRWKKNPSTIASHRPSFIRFFGYAKFFKQMGKAPEDPQPSSDISNTILFYPTPSRFVTKSFGTEYAPPDSINPILTTTG
jgi:hypothetical protein